MILIPTLGQCTHSHSRTNARILPWASNSSGCKNRTSFSQSTAQSKPCPSNLLMVQWWNSHAVDHFERLPIFKVHWFYHIAGVQLDSHVYWRPRPKHLQETNGRDEIQLAMARFFDTTCQGIFKSRVTGWISWWRPFWALYLRIFGTDETNGPRNAPSSLFDLAARSSPCCQTKAKTAETSLLPNFTTLCSSPSFKHSSLGLEELCKSLTPIFPQSSTSSSKMTNGVRSGAAESKLRLCELRCDCLRSAVYVKSLRRQVQFSLGPLARSFKKSSLGSHATRLYHEGHRLCKVHHGNGDLG